MKFFLFPFFYIKEILVGTVQIARDVIMPKQRLAPVLLHVPLNNLTPGQRLLLACLVSMTPGTIAVAEENAGNTMVIHALYGATDPDAAISHIKTHYETIVARLPI